MFGKQEIINRIDGLDHRLQKIEASLESLSDKERQVDGLAKQGLQLVGLLDEARAEIEQLKRDQNS